MLAGSVIHGARDRHPAFDRNRNPDGLALRALSEAVKGLHGKVAAIDETVLATEHIVAMPLADHNAGIVLPTNRTVLGVTARLTGSTADDPRIVPIALIPWAHRFDRNRPEAATWMYMGRLYLRSPASVWNTVVEIGVSLVRTPDALASLDDVLPLPDEAGLSLIEAVSFAFARRGHADPALPPIDLSAFALIAQRAESDYLADVANRATSVSFQTRDVWP